MYDTDLTTLKLLILKHLPGAPEFMSRVQVFIESKVAPHFSFLLVIFNRKEITV